MARLLLGSGSAAARGCPSGDLAVRRRPSGGPDTAKSWPRPEPATDEHRARRGDRYTPGPGKAPAPPPALAALPANRPRLTLAAAGRPRQSRSPDRHFHVVLAG